MLGEGVWTEVRVGNEHWRLFAEDNVQGAQASVYNVISKTWIAPSGSVADLEQGKGRAEETSRPAARLQLRTTRDHAGSLEILRLGLSLQPLTAVQ